MRISETAWSCFRNLEPRRQEWRSGLNVFSGPNGSGKTNILESFNVLSGWGVFPSSGGRVSSVITWAPDENAEKRAFLSALASGERELEIAAQIGERLSLRVAGERTTNSELRMLLPSLSFLPSDVNILDGSPSVRRFFLDKICALCSPLYARRLAEYRQLVRQRTALLRRNEDRSQSAPLRASSIPIAQMGGWIRQARKKAVDLLGEKLSAGNSPFENDLSAFGLSVAVDMRNGDAGNVKAGIELGDYTESLRAALDAGLERERRAGLVLSGPHRDDLMFSCLGRPASLALSRGQKRRVVMAVILAAGRLIETKLRVKPILILDDVAAELDADGRSLMGQALAETGWQVFASGVENPFETAACATWRIRDGKIENR